MQSTMLTKPKMLLYDNIFFFFVTQIPLQFKQKSLLCQNIGLFVPNTGNLNKRKDLKLSETIPYNSTKLAQT